MHELGATLSGAVPSQEYRLALPVSSSAPFHAFESLQCSSLGAQGPALAQRFTSKAMQAHALAHLQLKLSSYLDRGQEAWHVGMEWPNSSKPRQTYQSWPCFSVSSLLPPKILQAIATNNNGESLKARGKCPNCVSNTARLVRLSLLLLNTAEHVSASLGGLKDLRLHSKQVQELCMHTRAVFLVVGFEIFQMYRFFNAIG